MTWHNLISHRPRTLNKMGGKIMYYGSFHLSDLIRTWVCQVKISLPQVRSEIVGSRIGTASIHRFIGKIRKSTVPTWQAWLGHKAQGRRRVTSIRVGFSFLKFNFLHRTYRRHPSYNRWPQIWEHIDHTVSFHKIHTAIHNAGRHFMESAALKGWLHFTLWN